MTLEKSDIKQHYKTSLFLVETELVPCIEFLRMISGHHIRKNILR